MQIPKFSLWLCALALGTALTLRADDTPAQAAARVALEAKLKELNAQSPPPATTAETAPAQNGEAMTPVSSETGKVAKAKAKADKAAAELKAKQDADQAAADLKAKNDAEKLAAKQAAKQKEAEVAAAKAKAKADRAAAELKAKQDADQAAAELKAKKAAEIQAAKQKEAEAQAAKAQAKAKPVVNTPAPVIVPGVQSSSQTADNEAQAKARAALEAKLKEMSAQSSPPATTAETAPAQNGAAMMPVTSEAGKVDNAQAKADQTAAKLKAKQDADRAAAELAAEKAAEKQAAKQKKAEAAAAEAQAKTGPVKPAEVNYPGKDLGMKPIVAPALPITATKAEKLQALLAKYKADQISPEEYHKQRAEILAAP